MIVLGSGILRSVDRLNDLVVVDDSQSGPSCPTFSSREVDLDYYRLSSVLRLPPCERPESRPASFYKKGRRARHGDQTSRVKQPRSSSSRRREDGDAIMISDDQSRHELLIKKRRTTVEATSSRHQGQ